MEMDAKLQTVRFDIERCQFSQNLSVDLIQFLSKLKQSFKIKQAYSNIYMKRQRPRIVKPLFKKG